MRDEDIIQEAIEFLEFCQDVDDISRAEALDDLRFRNGEQWTEQERRLRELDGRPCLTNNNIPAIIHQVTNDVRQNEQAIHVHPSDAEANDEVAEIIEGLCRHIEYDSGADAAYDTAVEYAASVGFGYFRLVTEYCDPMSFDQDMKIKRIRNPFTVYMDPTAEEADGSDARKAIISTRIPREVFKRDYPKAEATADYMFAGVGDNIGNWIDEKLVRIAEYYRIEEKSETLVRLSDGSARLATDKTPLPEGVMPTGETRETVTRKIMLYKLTAKDILERAEVPFDWIPIFPVYGDEIDIDGQTFRNGLIRFVKDPKRMENYWMTSATEEVALRTKTPFIGALGAFEGMEEDWAQANVRNLPYLEYNQIALDGHLAPAPSRQPPADVPTGYIAMAGLARDAVKAVTGIYDASLGNRSNETSGLAIRARQQQGDISNFHIPDNLARAIRHLGRTIISGIPRVYDTQRILRIVRPDGTHENVEVNKPETKLDEFGQAVQMVANDMTVGKYSVVVSSGPAYNTLREEAGAAMVEMGGKWPKLMDVAGDKVVRALDWPGADEIAERIAKTLPPGLADDPDKGAEGMVMTQGGPIPPQQAAQMIQQMDQTLSAMHEEMQKLESGLAAKQIDADTRVKVAEIQAQAQHDNTELKGMIDLILAKMDPILAAQAAALSAQDEPEGREGAAKPKPEAGAAPQFDVREVLQQIGQAINPPRQKSLSIQAPSGAVYQGEVMDAPVTEQPEQPEAMDEGPVVDG